MREKKKDIYTPLYIRDSVWCCACVMGIHFFFWSLFDDC